MYSWLAFHLIFIKAFIVDPEHLTIINQKLLGYAIDSLNRSSGALWNLFNAEFSVDSEFGLKIDLWGRTSEHNLIPFWGLWRSFKTVKVWLHKKTLWFLRHYYKKDCGNFLPFLPLEDKLILLIGSIISLSFKNTTL